MMSASSSHNQFSGSVMNPAQQPMMSGPGGQRMMGQVRQMMTPTVGLTEQMLRSGNVGQLPNLSGQMIRGNANQIVNPPGQSIRGNMGQLTNATGQLIQTTSGVHPGAGPILQAGPPLQLQYIPGASPHPPGTMPHPQGSVQHPPGTVPQSPSTMPHPTQSHPLPPAPQLRGYHQSLHQIRFPVSSQQGFSVLQQQQSMVSQNNSMMYPIVNQQGQGHVIQHGPIMFPQNQQRSPANMDSKNNFPVHSRQY